MSEYALGYMAVPDKVAILLGRLAYHAAWLDDALGEAVVLASRTAANRDESPSGWAMSGEQLVKAVRKLAIDYPSMDPLANRLEKVNIARNQLVHGVWLWQDDAVEVMKRALGKGPPTFDHATYPYEYLERLIGEYQYLHQAVDDFIYDFMKQNPHVEQGAKTDPAK